RQADVQAQLLAKEGAINTLDDEIMAATRRIGDLQAALSRDQSARQWETTDLLLAQSREKLATRRAALDRYNELVAKLGLKHAPDNATFAHNTRQVTERAGMFESALGETQECAFKCKEHLGTLRQRLADIEAEATVSLKQKSRVPSAYVALRDKLAT